MSKLQSTAVKARRKAGESLQLFPTAPWATRAVIEQELLPRGWARADMTVWDPCCGKGHMALPLAEYFERVFATDIYDWGFGDRRDLDFTFASAEDAPWPVDWVFANPPFTLAEDFLFKALSIARIGVAMFVRLQWQEGGDRFHSVWDWDGPNRPHIVCPFAERVACIEEVWDPEASSATSYMWCVWMKDGSTRPFWPLRHIRPGAARRYSRLSDLALASPGEAARRKREREAT